MNGLWSNSALWVPITVSVLVQLFKFVVASVAARDLQYHVLTRTGGMPSSHSAMVCSLATAVGKHYGLGSDLFAVSAIFAIIVMYDASGVRQATGKHAKVLNQIMTELFSGQPISHVKLQELIGHTQLEVLLGALVGVSFTLAWLWFTNM